MSKYPKSMGLPGTLGDRHHGRVLAFAVGAALVALVVSVVVAFIQRGGPDARDVEPTSPPAGPASPMLSAVTWTEAGGVALPVSPTHGPRSVTNGLAKGYTLDEGGAAVAAANLLIRTGPTVGPRVFEPTVAEQSTGANVAALKVAVNEQYEQLRASSGVPDGDPVPGANAELTGYRLDTYDADSGRAIVAVVLTSPDLASTKPYLQITVSLLWINEDWWVVAPPNGDWAAVSTSLAAAPVDLLRYQDVN